MFEQKTENTKMRRKAPGGLLEQLENRLLLIAYKNPLLLSMPLSIGLSYPQNQQEEYKHAKTQL